jgi:diadenosine tetraphosphate (Ap4A) HIT family hydrolase
VSCPFCGEVRDGAVLRNELAYAVRDGFPVNPGHTLIIPHRHVASWFEATADEQRAMLELVAQAKQTLDQELAADGYNIGLNLGEAAGQTVMHLHLHLIPRFSGDVDDPTGGVRLVIPERGNYRRAGHIPRSVGAPQGS